MNETKERKVELYLEQIKYVSAENSSIQEKFLASVDVPLVALGLFIFYIETSAATEAKQIYLLLPFLCFSILFNLIKYTIRILINNGYLKHLEKQINLLMNDKMFLLNRVLKDTSTFSWGFAVSTTLVQIPIYLAISSFLMREFIEAFRTNEGLGGFGVFLVVCLVVEVFLILIMLMDLILVQTKVIMKIEEIMADEDYLQSPEEEGWIKKLFIRAVIFINRKQGNGKMY